jgi:hypothetical protein
MFSFVGYRHPMTNPSHEKLTRADPEDLAAAFAFALKFRLRPEIRGAQALA